MQVTDIIRNKINRYPFGFVFTYSNIISNENQKEAAIKALNRFVKEGKLKKITKGKFYKPKTTEIGVVPLDSTQIVQDLLKKDGKIIGYLTGINIYNKLGITTQVSNTIEIGSNFVRPPFKRANYSIKYKKQKNHISEKNILFLQVLDAIKDIKKIPGSNIAEVCNSILNIIAKFNLGMLENIILFSIKYPPYTRALLGCLIDNTNKDIKLEQLYASLNPITSYNLPGVSQVLGSTNKWRIEG